MKVIQLYNLLTVGVPDEGYTTIESCACTELVLAFFPLYLNHMKNYSVQCIFRMLSYISDKLRNIYVCIYHHNHIGGVMLRGSSRER